VKSLKICDSEINYTSMKIILKIKNAITCLVDLRKPPLFVYFWNKTKITICITS